MICPGCLTLLAVNRQREKRGLPRLSRRDFCTLAATSSAALAAPFLFGCESNSTNSPNANAGAAPQAAGTEAISQGGTPGTIVQAGSGGAIAQGGSGGTTVQGGTGGTDPRANLSYDEWDYTDDKDMTVTP